MIWLHSPNTLMAWDFAFLTVIPSKTTQLASAMPKSPVGVIFGSQFKYGTLFGKDKNVFTIAAGIGDPFIFTGINPRFNN